MLEIEVGRALPPKEKYSLQSGIERYPFDDGTLITGVSAQNWGEFIQLIPDLRSDDRIIVTPELITCAELSLVEVERLQDIVEARVAEIKARSCEFPESLFIIGTPLFSGEKKPKNGAVFLKNGMEIFKTYKRTAATEAELNAFDVSPNQLPITIPGTKTSFLICSDLAIAPFFLNDKTTTSRVDLLRYVGKEYLIGVEPRFFDEGAQNLVVMSCWAVGSIFEDLTKTDAGAHYQRQLRNIIWDVMKHTSIKDAVVVDRSPDLNMTKPINGFFSKQ